MKRYGEGIVVYVVLLHHNTNPMQIDEQKSEPKEQYKSKVSTKASAQLTPWSHSGYAIAPASLETSK